MAGFFCGAGGSMRRRICPWAPEVKISRIERSALFLVHHSASSSELGLLRSEPAIRSIL
jgi:hypothetical protein